jgi:hypothetical protein
MGMGGQCRLTHGKDTRYSLGRSMGGPRGRSERMRKISLAPALDDRIFQPVASRYTDWAIPVHVDR